MREHDVKCASQAVFQRWTRKSYAVFNSLHKVVKISGLALGVVAVMWTHEAEAQQDTTKAMKECYLEETEVVAQRSVVVNGELAKVVTVISRKEIAAAPVQTLQDVLNTAMNVDLRQRGKNDIQADLSIRAGTFDQNLILLNGIPLNDPQTGHHNLNLPIDLSQIERIEILSGPGSKASGPNAYSGAINIVTRIPRTNELELQAHAGQYGLMKGSVSLSLYNKGVSHLLSVNGDQSNGYTDNTDFQRINAFYSGFYRKQNTYWQWQAGFTDKAFGANSFYTPKYPDQFEQTRSAFGSIKFRKQAKNWNYRATAYYRGHTDRFELFREGSEVASWYSNHNYHFTNVAGMNANVSFTSKFGVTNFGADYRFEGVLSNVLGTAMNDTMTALFDSEGFYTKSAQRNNIGLSLEHVVRTKKMQAVAGVMMNYNSMLGSTNWNPGIDFTYKLNDYWKLLASANTAMRLPTYTDLYYNGPTNIGNPDLKAEESVNFEVGVSHRSKRLKGTSFNANAYYAIGKNTIDWVRSSDTVKWQPMNHTNLHTKGVEANVRLNPAQMLGNDDFFMNFLQFSYSFNHIDKESDENLTSFYVLDYLQHKFNAQLRHRIYGNLYASYALTFQDRAGTYSLYDALTGTSTEVNYDPFTLLDVRVYWNYANWYVFVDASNILNVDYVDIGNVNQPGRWVSAGVKYRLQFKN
jgi:iron complex outermembrane receptor protein